MDKTEEKSKVTGRQRLRDRYSKKYPDRSFEGEEGDSALDDLAIQDLEDYETREGENKKNNDRLVDLFTKEPRVAGMINDWAAGGDPLAYMIDNFGTEFLDALETEGGRDKFLEKHDKWIKDMQSDKEFKEERDANWDKSLAELEAFKNEKGLSDDQAAEVFQKVYTIGSDVLEGKIGKDVYGLALKAMNYDGAVEEAKTEGEVNGRNAKIDAQLRSSEKARATLPPNLGGQGARAEEGKPAKAKKQSMFGI